MSFFHGIKIQMYWSDHPPPHFHAFAEGDVVVIDIRSFTVLRGDLPAKKLALIFRMGTVAPGRAYGGMGAMLEIAIPANHYTATLVSGETVRSNVPWRVTHVEARPDFQLFVQFIDGTAGMVEMREQIFSDQAGVFAALRDPIVFGRVRVNSEFGSVEWANGLDIAPDATYEEIQRNGAQVLR